MQLAAISIATGRCISGTCPRAKCESKLAVTNKAAVMNVFRMIRLLNGNSIVTQSVSEEG